MNLYFSSTYPCAIKLNGMFFACVADEIKPCNIDDNVFIEVCPLSTNEQTVNFFPTNDFFCFPPDGITVTDLKGGFLVRFNKKNFKKGFGITGQQKFNDVIVTLFNENGIKLSIETPNDFYASELPSDTEKMTAKKIRLCDTELLLAETCGKEKTIFIFRYKTKIEKIFEKSIFSYSVSDSLFTTEKITDIAGHEITVNWNFKNNKFFEDNRSIKVKEGFSVDKLNSHILPYAFAEEFCVGGDVTFYLADNVLNNLSKLKSYLGNYIGVMPPPLFRNEKEVGLIYKKTDNVYEIKYFIFELENRKIVNIKCSE